jgi:hypothetical protein
MTLEEIYLKEDVSLRAINTCKVEGLYDLQAISEFYKANSTFLSLRNCGKRTNRELIDLCNKYDSNINIFTNENQYFTAPANLGSNEIKSLNNFIRFEFELLSVRSKNILRDILDNNFDILNFIEKLHLDKHFDIYKVRNVGVKTAEEIQCLIKKVEILILQSAEMDFDPVHDQLGENGDLDNTTNLTQGQISIINNFIVSEYAKLSVRVRNSLNDLLDYDLDFRNFSDKILLSEDFAFYRLRNIGAKSVVEFDQFITLVIDYLREIKDDTDQSLLHPSIISYFAVNRSSYDSYTSIFQLVDDFINQNKIYKKANEKLIFQEGFKIYANTQEITLEKLGEILNLTRERIRQIRNRIITEIPHKFQFIKEFKEDLFEKYNIDLGGHIIIIDSDRIELVNKLNKTSLSHEFITFLIYIYLSDEFDLIGEIDNVLLPKYFNSRERYNWNNFYLVNKKVSYLFNFNDFANDLNKRLNERIVETYNFNFKSYVSNFSTASNSATLNILSEVAEYILNNEFGIYIDINDSINFYRNKPIQLHELAIEALEKLGKPSTLEEIYNVIKSSRITKSKESLRSSLHRSPEIICFGRSSTYGLKKWELERDDIKGGTIKNIILEYLQKNNNPVHILELLHEVHKYRERTNAKNIITNLKFDSQNQFIIYNQSFIGLSGKTYNSSLTFLPKFLGRTITTYIKQQKSINRITVEEYFSSKLKISQKNMNYIIDYLIEQQFVFIDNQNYLSI